MSVEFIGMIHHRQASEIHPPPPIVLDRGYIREFAQAAEAGGFDRVLVGYFADGPDGFLVAAAAAAHTERLELSGRRTGPAMWRPLWRRASSRRWIKLPAQICN